LVALFYRRILGRPPLRLRLQGKTDELDLMRIILRMMEVDPTFARLEEFFCRWSAKIKNLREGWRPEEED